MEQDQPKTEVVEAKPSEAKTPETSENKETKPEKKKSKKASKIFRDLVFVFILGLIVVVVVFLINFINSSSSIIAKADDSRCTTDYCIKIQTDYDNGWSLWRPGTSLPSLLSVTAGGFNQGDKLVMICPITYSNGDNQLVAKMKFISDYGDIRKCLINKAD